MHSLVLLRPDRPHRGHRLVGVFRLCVVVPDPRVFVLGGNDGVYDLQAIQAR